MKSVLLHHHHTNLFTHPYPYLPPPFFPRSNLPLTTPSALKKPRGFGTSSAQKKQLPKKQKIDNLSKDDDDEEDSVPEIETNRMIKRMALSVGAPLGVGILFFPFFYYLKAVAKLDVPNWVPFIVSLVLFGAAFLGVTYGIVSASWDPLREGSVLGWNEARKNWPVFLESIRGGGRRK